MMRKEARTGSKETVRGNRGRDELQKRAGDEAREWDH